MKARTRKWRIISTRNTVDEIIPKERIHVFSSKAWKDFDWNHWSPEDFVASTENIGLSFVALLGEVWAPTPKEAIEKLGLDGTMVFH